MNLIVGATGGLGAEICRELSKRGKPVRAMVRQTAEPAARSQIEQSGVEIVQGDLKDTDSLRAACDGVSTVISTATVIQSKQADDSFAAVDDAGHRALIESARAAGVQHFIFISVSPNINVPCPLVDAKRAVERYAAQSGLPSTILQPTPFFEIWLGAHLGWDHANHKAQILGTGEQRISYIARDDVMKYAVACVDNTAARGRTIPLGGPEAISPRQALATFEKLAGARYEVQQVPEAELEARYAAAEHPTQKTFAGLMLALSRDDRVEMGATSREFGVKPTALEDYAKRVVSS